MIAGFARFQLRRVRGEAAAAVRTERMRRIPTFAETVGRTGRRSLIERVEVGDDLRGEGLGGWGHHGGVLVDDARAVRDAIDAARTGLVDREMLVEVVALAAVAGEHVLVVGPPGTAKSEAVRRIAAHLGGQYFEYLLGRFTEPNEIFGPVDLRRLREGVVEIETAGMLPEAEIAFLDEVFHGSSAILNTLLGILNERVFRRGSTTLRCPIRVCVGATNTIPDDTTLAAFADRFLVRVFVEPLADARLEDLLEAGWALGRDAPPSAAADIAAIDRLAAAGLACDLIQVRGVIGAALRRLRSAGIPITDRRAVRSQRLIAAAAVLDGRSVATEADLWPLCLVSPTADAQRLARDALEDMLGPTTNGALPHAAELISQGPLARADRLVAAGRALLQAVAVPTSDRDERLRVEAALREIDAGFSAAEMPAALAEMRTALVAALT
jgi:MoxR-like ATPase